VLQMANSPLLQTFMLVLVAVSIVGSVISVWGWVKKGRIAPGRSGVNAPATL